MLFHCGVTRNVSSASAFGPNGSDGWLYYLTVRNGGKWDAKWTPIPILSQDVTTPCSGTLCNGFVGGSPPPDEVAGNESSGHVVPPAGSASNPAPTPSTTSQSTQPNPATGSSTAQTSPSASTSTSTTTSSPSALARCGTVTGGNDDYQGQQLTVHAGTGVSCATAMKVIGDLSAGRATNHPGPNDASSYFAVDGWKCPYGNMGVQVCSKGDLMVNATATS
jgi:hypothetical protein